MLSELCIVHFSNASRLAEKPYLIQAKDTFTILLKVINVKTYDTKQLRDDDFGLQRTSVSKRAVYCLPRLLYASHVVRCIYEGNFIFNFILTFKLD